MTKLLKALFKLNLKQGLVVILAWWMFIGWHLVITYLPYRWWRGALTRNSDLQPQADIHLRALAIVSLSEKVARHHFVKINCLRRCMVQKQLLHFHNINSQLSIGVKKDNKQLAAHCWLVVNNHIVNDSLQETQRYVELQRLKSGDHQNSEIFKNFK